MSLSDRERAGAFEAVRVLVTVIIAVRDGVRDVFGTTSNREGGGEQKIS
ncbi:MULTISPECIES: hypothetical protein [Halorussus]|nr:hypothetical protein [Halorussus vallis]USZ76908.1 hypothetical protein NGM07_06155 [Halorussus vallis]